MNNGIADYCLDALLSSRLKETYTHLGWEIEPSSEPGIDYIAHSDNRSVYLSLINYADPEGMSKKIDDALEFIDDSKPMYYVMTDTDQYDLYFDGEYYSTVSFPLSKDDLEALYESEASNG